MDAPDQSLIDRYLSGSDDKAFGMIVTRYVDFVHAIAFRVTGNHELARDVAQTTFIRLARRAALIPRHVTLTAWLHRVTRGLAVDLVRTESRRKQRELGSTLIPSPMDNADPDPDWSTLAPIIDELVEHLPAADRDLILLRYYRNQSHAAIATRLGLTESVARKRAFRAVEKLRSLLGKRGITTSAAALATLLPAHAAPSAPGLLSTSILHATRGITPIAPHFLTTILLTVNTSQKIAIAASLLLLIAATGYSLSPDPSAALAAAAATKNSIRSAQDTGDTRATRVRNSRIVPISQEDRFERLKSIMAISDRTERHEKLIAYLNVLPPGLFAETTGFLEDIRFGEDIECLVLLASAWARVDLPAALDFARNKSKIGFVPYLVKDWGMVDPEAAMTWTLEQFPDDPSYVDAVLQGALRTFPEKIGALVRSVPPGEALWTVFEKMAPDLDKDPALMLRVVEGASESQRAVIYGKVALETKNYPKGFKLLKEHPEAVPFSSPTDLFRQWSIQDNAAATAALRELPVGELKEAGLSGLLLLIGQDAPSEALALIDRFPDAYVDEHGQDFIRKFGKTNPGLALGEAHRISNQEKRNSVVLSQLKSWFENDPDAAGAWIGKNPQPPSVLEQLPVRN